MSDEKEELENLRNLFSKISSVIDTHGTNPSFAIGSIDMLLQIHLERAELKL